MSRKWFDSATARGALIGGGAVLLATILTTAVSVWLARSPSPDPAVISFTLNEDECFFQSVGDIKMFGVVAPLWSHTSDALTVMYALDAELNESTSAEDARAFYSDVPDDVPPARAREIWKAIRMGGEKRRKLESKLSPVFDVAVLNNGAGTAVLTHIQVEVLDVQSAGEGGGGDPILLTPQPLASLARYAIPLRRMYLEQYARSAWPRVTAVPPLEIPSNRPARFQIQLHSVDSGVTYRLRLRFIFNGTIDAASPFFGVRYYMDERQK